VWVGGIKTDPGVRRFPNPPTPWHAYPSPTRASKFANGFEFARSRKGRGTRKEIRPCRMKGLYHSAAVSETQDTVEPQGIT